MLDNETYLALSLPDGIWSSPVTKQNHHFPMVDIPDDGLENLRCFLNEMHNIRMREKAGDTE